jgi:polyferredoxin
MLAIQRNIMSFVVFAFVFLVLGIVQLYVPSNLLVLDRFFRGGGWIEITAIAIYGFFLFNKMKDTKHAPRWRKISWSVFSVVFFGQLILGLTGFDKFLMTGELHLPVPAMIISGPVYRGELSFMTLLFLSTVILTGPAWCSHLCYFGGLDNLAASNSRKKTTWKNKFRWKHSILLIIVAGTLVLRFFRIDEFYALAGGLFIGFTGLGIILAVTRRKGKMVHCTLYCPVGTVVMYLKYINPFRMYIDSSCTECGICSVSCNYDALTSGDIEKGRPGWTCTYCGDCISACNQNSIKYSFLGLRSDHARNLYLFLTISFHVMFLAMAKV